MWEKQPRNINCPSFYKQKKTNETAIQSQLKTERLKEQKKTLPLEMSRVFFRYQVPVDKEI